MPKYENYNKKKQKTSNIKVWFTEFINKSLSFLRLRLRF